MLSRGKAIGGALVLCALAVCMLGASSASAAGLTAVKCEKVGGVQEFNSSECTTGAGSGEFKTVELKETTNVEGTATTFSHALGSTAGNNPVAVLHGIVAGVKFTITCGASTVTGGDVLNTEEGGEMKVHGTKGVTNYSECHAHPETSPEKICDVEGLEPTKTAKGTLKTTELTTTTGPEHKVSILPASGILFTKFQILTTGTGCFIKSVLPLEVTGELNGRADTTTHSHLTLNAETNGTKLIVNGGAVPASYTSTVKFHKVGEPANAIGATTVP